MALKTINKAVEEIKKDYQEFYKNDQSMQDYCIGRISNGVILENGMLIEFEKPSIKKDFCFGAGQNGITTNEDWDDANHMVNVASSDEKYFIQKNFDDSFNSYKRLFEDVEKGWGVYASPQRYEEKSRLVHAHSEKYFAHRGDDMATKYKFSDSDITNIKNVIEEEKAKFLKRITTYLKKYGLSKVRSWSYISD